MSGIVFKQVNHKVMTFGRRWFGEYFRMNFAPAAAATPQSTSMADEAERSLDGDVCASALALFVTDGRALLRLAEKESRKGRQGARWQRAGGNKN